MAKSVKNFFITCLKLVIAAGLIYWMLAAGKLDFSKVGILFQKPDLLIWAGFLFFFMFIGLGALRWMTLLRGIGIEATYFRTLSLHMIGIFFNSTMPGAVGGDIIKAVYIIRDHQTQFKTPAALSILLDRVIGLMGLFFLGACAIFINLNLFWSNLILRPVILMVLGLLVGTIVFFVMVFIPTPDEKDPMLKLFSLRIWGFSLFRKIYTALRSYRKKPWSLIFAFLISVVIQAFAMMLFIKFTEAFNGTKVDIVSFATIFPIGILTTALPIAPGGLGVGHVAFDKLYEFIGLKNGANIFNVYFIVNLAFSLVGAIPYLLIRSGKAAPRRAEEEVSTEQISSSAI